MKIAEPLNSTGNPGDGLALFGDGRNFPYASDLTLPAQNVSLSELI
jgi:hypothetical protein